MDLIKFFKEESSKDLNIKADCNYVVVGKNYGNGWRILPYSIWYDETSKQYIALKVNKYGQAQPKINTVLDSNDHQIETVAYQTLKGAKQWVYNEVMGIGND